MSSPVRALIAEVDAGSPAEEAGLRAGDALLSVDGHVIHDVIDWQWFASEDEHEVTFLSQSGKTGCTQLCREDGSIPWGISFQEAVFDGVRTCRNSCTFCFMRQLPSGLRKTLSVRDDDFRLSFLQGNFVTLTNATADDVARIIAQRISPLRVSLHAVNERVRAALMGKHAPVGLRALEELLAGGIEVDAQIVLVPGVNDGAVLAETLAWAYGHVGIETVGIVPLGYTSHQTMFAASFNDPAKARAVIDQVRPFQERALDERGEAWVYAADEFYVNAYGTDVLEHLPEASFYGGFPMFEDGIGIVRACVDDFREAERAGAWDRVFEELMARDMRVVAIYGQAMEPYAARLFASAGIASRIQPHFVANRFFGGNVSVTGLLAGADIAAALKHHPWESALFLLPAVAFNADGVTVDGMSAEDIESVSGRAAVVVSSNPLDCIEQLMEIVKER